MIENHTGINTLRDRIAEIMGLYFAEGRLKDLETGLINAARELSINTDHESLKKWLFKTNITKNELNVLATHLTIGETYFFREQVGLDFFKEKIFPELLIQKKSPVKIWCAGCSSGEEPYTLAIILKEFFPEIQNRDYHILATDISPVAIQKAIQGEYTAWSFRTTPENIKHKYFSMKQGKYLIDPEIRNMVEFEYLNLAKTTFPAYANNTENIDVIFCRNVMMYFKPELIKAIGNRFMLSLNENGYLITSQVELSDEYFGNFTKTNFSNGIFYQKKQKLPILINSNKPIGDVNNGQLIAEASSKKLKKPAKTQVINVIKEQTIDKQQPANLLNRLKTLESDAKFQDIYKIVQEISVTENYGLEAEMIISRSFANIGKHDEAMRWLHKITEEYPAHDEAYLLIANILIEKKMFEQALFELNKALYLKPEKIGTHLLAGSVAIQAGKSLLAMKHYRNALSLLDALDNEVTVADAEGLSAGTLKKMILKMIG